MGIEPAHFIVEGIRSSVTWIREILFSRNFTWCVTDRTRRNKYFPPSVLAIEPRTFAWHYGPSHPPTHPSIHSLFMWYWGWKPGPLQWAISPALCYFETGLTKFLSLGLNLWSSYFSLPGVLGLQAYATMPRPGIFYVETYVNNVRLLSVRKEG